MKKYIKIISVLIIIALLLLIPVFAHPGRTDANGGHWNRKEGTYHFHSGGYAGKGYSGSSSSSEYVPFTPPYDPPTENPYRSSIKTHSTSSNTDSIIASFFSYAIVILITAVPVYIIGLLAFEKHLPEFNINKYDKILNEIIYYKKEITQLEINLEKVKSDYSVPTEYEVGADNLPKEKNSKSWGKSFTIYKTASGKKLHCKRGCCNATVKMHIYNYCYNTTLNYGYYNRISRLLCQKCSSEYTVPQFDWYISYLKDKSLSRKLDELKQRYLSIQCDLEKQHKKCNSLFFRFLSFFNRCNKQKIIELNEKYNTYNIISKRT